MAKSYDLEERTFNFAIQISDYVGKLNKTLTNIEYGKQLARSSGSVAANYIEANEPLGKNDFYMRLKICRKEMKESIMWLKLTIPTGNEDKTQKHLIVEGTEIMKIFGSIITKIYKNYSKE